ncbi:MAG: DNA methyltransferase [Chthoniobacteraceae bacterium]
MASHPSFETFQAELNRLTGLFEKNLTHYKKPGYDEASLRQEFLNPLFAALGWDVENKAGHIPQKREVEVESRTHIGGRQKRADYLFRTEGIERFVCEAKKPAVSLEAKEAFQAKRYGYNMRLPIAVLTDFEEMKIFIVNGRPYLGEPQTGEWKTWHFKQYALVAEEMWNLLSREKVAAGAIEQELDKLPKKRPAGKGKAKQQWLIKPDRSRTLDHDFLEFLDEARKSLASDIYKHNDHAALMEGNALNEAVQRILDRILFLRICEDRDIDTGTPLQSIVETWRRNYGHDEGRKFRQESFRLREDSSLDLDDDGRSSGGGGGILAPKESLWHAIVRHFRALDRRPASHVPYFNGNIFKLHDSERLIVGDEWLADFIGELSSEETPYLFNVIPVEILGSVYERFLGKVVRPHGKGITVEEKPEVRKAGGVYYTPRYIVDYIVEQTVGRQLDAIAGIPASDLSRPESTAPRRSTQAKGSARFQRAASGILPDAPDIAGAAGSAKPPASREPGWLRQDAEAGTLEACAPVSSGDTREVTPAAFEKASLALRILDPACGSGSFLIRAFERVCEHWQQWLTENREQRKRKWCWVDADTGDVHLTVDLKRRILTQNIYGVDLDAAAVEVTQLSLYLKMLEHENRTTMQRERELFAEAVAVLPPLEGNIKCGNSLIASDFSMMHEDLLRVNAFDWPTGFREIMKAGGFDAVVGNPPYIRIQTMQESDPEAVDYIGRNYVSAAKGNYDIYVVFLERALGLLTKTGRLGYIVPHKFFNAQYGAALRQHLSNGRHVCGITHFGHQQIFEGATTYTCLLFLQKTPVSLLRFAKVDDLEAWAQSKVEVVSDIPIAKLSGGDWVFAAGPAGGLLDKLAKVPATLESITTRIFQGIKTSADKIYIVEERDRKGKQVLVWSPEREAEYWLEADLLHPLIKGGDSKRYSMTRTNRLILFPYEKGEDGVSRLIGEAVLKERLPKTWSYLSDNKRYLESRENRKMVGPKWYAYIYPKALDVMPLPKLFTPDIAPHASFSYDQTGECFFTGGVAGGYGILCNEGVEPKIVLGLVNSRVLSWVVSQTATQMRGGYLSFEARFIRSLPIILPKPKTARHDKLVEQVDKMLALVPKLRGAKNEKERGVLQNAVDSTDRKIDDLVYELYALTPEEIALVEGTK